MKLSKRSFLASAALLVASAAMPVTGRAGVITTNQTITTAPVDSLFVQSGTVTVSNLTISNLSATGGTGSGGGAGMGGAVFVNTGANVTLTNVNLIGNQAIGGAANAAITTGGSLNGTIFVDNTAGTPGLAGSTPAAQHYLDANGTGGTNGARGTASATGLGGLGGAGGAGGNGDATEAAIPYILDVTVASTNVVGLAATIAGASQPFTASEVPGLLLQAVSAGIDLGGATAALIYYDKAIQSGQIGVGGDGGSGGNAGASALGFGGVAGGAGGAGGNGTEERSASAFNGGAAGGNGGDGGQGGLGGFGAGGGKGGNGGAGGVGANVGADPGRAATPAVYQYVDLPDQYYEKGYFWDNDNNAGTPNVFVKQQGLLTDPLGAPYATIDPDGAGPSPAVNIVTRTETVYEKGYYWNDDNNAGTPDVWVQQAVSQETNAASGTIDPDGSGPSPAVNIVTRTQTAATQGQILVTPAQEAVAATTSGKRPDGAAGAGGAGGAGGFGAGAGTSGSGSDSQVSGGSGGSGFGGAIFVRGGTLTIAGDSTFDGNDVRGGNGAAATASVAAGQAGSGYGTDMFVMTGATVNLTPGAGKVITFNGSIADDSVVSGYSTNIAAGNGASINISGGGTVVFNGTNTYSGTTFVTGTVLQAIDGTGVNAQSHISMDGGAIFQSSGTFTRRLGNGITQLTMGSSSGFAANGGDLTVTLNSNSPLVWGSTTGFVTGALVFGSDSADATVKLTNAINLNGAARTILVTDNTNSDDDKAVISGVISGAGGLTVGDATHTGILQLTAVNTYTGGTIINGGTLALAGAGSLLSTGAVTVNATFDISQANGARTIGDLSGASTGVIALGANNLTVTQTSDGVFAGVIADGGLGGGVGGSFTKAGSANLELSGANTYTGATNVNAGTLTLSGSLVSNAVTIASGATLNDTAGGLASDTVATVNGTLTLTNTGDTIKTLNGTSTGVVNVNGGSLTVSDGTFAGAINGTQGLVKTGLAGDTLTLSGTNGYTGTTAVNAGTLTLSGTGSLASLVVNVASGATLNDNGGLTTGLASGAALTNAGTVVLAGDDTIASYTSTGTLNGAGKTLTAATYDLNNGSVVNANLGTGTVNANGTVAINGTSNASQHNILTGTTTLGGAERLVDTTTVAISSGAKLVLGGAETIATLNGAGTLDNTAGPLTVSNGAFSGDITGTGALNKVGTAGDTLTLTGANTFTGAANVNNGTLVLSGAGSLATTTVKVASGASLNDMNGGLASGATLTNAGTVTLGAADTIAAYVSNAGTLAGAGQTLTAATYALNNNSVVSANLGTGVVNANGTVTISGTSNASQHNIVTGTTTLVGDERLTDTTTVAIASGATLVLGGVETIKTLNGAGTLNNTAGDLTVSDGAWAGDITGTGAVNKDSSGQLTVSGANTFTGAFNANAGTTTLTGSLATTTVNIASGALLDDVNSGLAAGATVTNDGRLVIGKDETIAVLNGTDSTAELSLTGISTGGLTLTGGTLSLGSLTGVTFSGSSLLGGTLGGVDFSGVSLAGLSLTDVTLTVGADGVVSLTGGTLTGGTLTGGAITGGSITGVTFLGGTLTGGTLTGGALGGVSPTGATFTGGTISGLTLTGLTFNGVTLTGGSLTGGTITGVSGTGSALGATVSGATLATGPLTGGSLTVGSGDYAGIISGDKTLNKVTGGTLTLSGTSTHTGTINVDAGTLNLTGSTESLVVNVDSGATLLDVNGGLAEGATLTNEGTVTLSANDTIATFVSNAGTLNGAGQTLTAATYALNTGTVVNANLGTGVVTINGTVAINGTSDASVHNIVTGTTTLGSGERLIDTTTVDISSGATLVLGGVETIKTLNGAGTLNNNAGALTVSDGTWAGNITGGSAVNKTSSGELVLSGTNTFTGAFNANAGTTTLTGSLATNTVNILAGATLSDVNSGLQNGATVRVDGTLTLGAAETIRTLNGAATGVVNVDGGSLTVTSGNFAGAINGANGLVKNGTLLNILTLSGNNGYTGTTDVNGGTLVLTGSLASLAVNVASGAILVDTNGGLSADAAFTNAGTVTLTASDTVASYTSNGGRLVGLGTTLTAETYALNNNSVVIANLGTGVVTANGTVSISGTSNASVHNIESGTTSLTLANRLIATTTVNISAGATLVTGGAETIATLNGAGNLNMNAGSFTLNGGDFTGVISATNAARSFTKVSTDTLTLGGANTFTGAANFNAGTTVLNGSLATTTVNVASGATLTDANAGLASGATLTNAGIVNVTVDDTIDILNNTGTINGPGTLFANTYNLGAGSVINGNLGTGILYVNADVALNGTSGATTVIITGTGVLTLGSAERLDDTASVTMTAPGSLILGGDETIGTLDGAGTVDVNAGNLILSGGTFAGDITGANGVVKNGAGTLTLSGTNGYTGTTQVNSGTLDLTGSTASLVVNVASGATLNDTNGGLADGAALTNAGTVVLGADDTVASFVSNGGTLSGSGFTLTAATYALNDGSTIDANLGTGVLTANGAVALNGTSLADTVNIVTGTTTLGFSERLADTATLTVSADAKLVLGGDETVTTLEGSGEIVASAGSLIVSNGNWAGVISGTEGLVKNSAGELTLDGANTYEGATVINAGLVTLTGSIAGAPVTIASGATLDDRSGGLADSTVLTLDGTVNLYANEKVTTLDGGATGLVNLIDGGLTVSDGTFAGVIAGDTTEFGLTKVSGGTLTLSGDSTFIGTALVSEGTLSLTGSLSTQTVTVASGATLDDVNGGLSGNTVLTVEGTVNLLSDEAVKTLRSTGTTGVVNLTGGDFTVSNGDYAGILAGTDPANSLEKISVGDLTLRGANTFVGTTHIAGGSITLLGDGSLASAIVIIDAGTTLNNTVGGLASGAALTNAGTINLGATGDDTVATLVNSGTINGTATLTASTYALNSGSVINANLGEGVVTANGTVALNGTVAALTVDVVTGTTTLGSAERLDDTATVTISGGATLATGGAEKIGTLDGAGALNVSGGTLTASSGFFSGVISSVNNVTGLTKADAGVLTLSGASTYLGLTTITGGRLDLLGSLASRTVNIGADGELYSPNAGLSQFSTVTNAGQLNLGGTNDTIAAFVTSGYTMGGTLTAATYALNDGSVTDADLGTGIVTANGTVRLNGASSASVHNIVTGTTTLGSAERLIDTTTVAISSGATLVLGGVETIKTLNGAGTLDNTAGALTVSDGAFSGDITGTSAVNKVSAGTLTLSGTNTFTGNANVNAGTLALTGTLATETVNILSGATLSDVNGGLVDTVVVTVDGTLSLGANETVTTLLGAGTVALGANTLTVSDGSFSGALNGTGGLTKVSVGSLLLSGTSGYTGTTAVDAGSLTLTGSLASLTVNVASGAILSDEAGGLASGAALTNAGSVGLGANDTVASFVSNGGYLEGSAFTLTAATYALNDGSVINANLGAGIVTTNGIVALNGTSSADTVNIVTGELSLGTNERLADTATVTVSSGALLTLGGSETFATLNGAGTVNNNLGDLTVSDGSFSGVVTGASSLNKVSSGTLTLSGANTFTGAANVNAGTLALTGTLTTETVNIASGATLSDVNGGLASGSTVRVDGTLALESNETINRLRGSGTVSLGGSLLTVSRGWFTGAINGTGDLTVDGGWLGLTGDSGYTGTTTVASGTLSLRGSLASSVVTVSAGALLDNRSGGLAATTALTVEGTMNLGASEEVASLAGSGTVDLGSSVLTVSSGEFSGAINGAGDLTKVSAGTLTLSGVSGYTGTTTVSAGTLTLTGRLDSQSVSVATGATLNSEHAGLHIDSALTNAGTVLIGAADETVGSFTSNGGTLSGSATLTAATYALNGGTTINANLGAGTMTVDGYVLLAGTSAAEIVKVNSDANLVLVSADRLADNAVVTVDGRLTLLGGDDTIRLLYGSGIIDGGSEQHTLHVTGGGYFTGSIANETVILNSSGDLTLTGASSIAQLVHVTGGTLTLSGAAASITTPTITIDFGAALTIDSFTQLNFGLLNGSGTVNYSGEFINTGVGRIAGNLTFNGDFRNQGAMAPGNSPGITTIVGNYTEAGTQQLEIGGLAGPGVNPNGFDQIRVGGIATLTSAGTMVVEGFNGFAPARGQSFQLISDLAGGTKQLNGTLGSVQFDIDGIAGPGLPVTNAAGVLDLRTGRVITSGLNAANSKFSDLGATGNEKSAIGAIFAGAQLAPNQIDTATAAGDAAAQLLFSTGTAASANLAFFIPTGYEALLDYGAASSRLAARLNDRVGSFNTLPAGQSLNGGFYAGAINAETKTSHDNARYTRNDFYAGADFGIAKGFELGLYANGNTGTVRNDTLRSEASGVGAGIYGKAGITDRLGVKGSFAYSADEFDNKRRTLAGNVNSDTDVDTFSGALTLEYLAYKNESFSLAPRAGFVATESRAKGFSESGASDALHIDAFSSTRISARAGASAVWSTRGLGLPLSLELTGDLDQAIHAEATDLDATFVNNSAVRYPLRPEDDRDTSFIYGVNAGFGITDTVSLFLGYQGRIGYTPSNDFNVSVRVRF